MIVWRLNILMAERQMKNNRLAAMTGLHPVTICNLKKLSEVPERLERNTLEKLCAALNCQPGELMVWEPDVIAAIEVLDQLPISQTDNEKVVLQMREEWD